MQAPVLTDDTKAAIQRIVESDYQDSFARHNYFSGLYAAHKILTEMYPGQGMPDNIHRSLILAMEECTAQIRGERADGPGAC